MTSKNCLNLFFIPFFLFQNLLFAEEQNVNVSNSTVQSHSSQLDIDPEKTLPETIQALNQLPPEKSIELLEAAHNDIMEFSKKIEEYEEEIRQVKLNPRVSSAGSVIYELKVPIYLVAGGTAVFTVVRELSLVADKEFGYEKSGIFRFKNVYRTYFFWGAASLFALEVVHNEYHDQKIALDELKIRSLDSSIRRTRSQIENRQNFIETMMQFQKIRIKTSQTVTNTTEVSK